MMAYPGGESAGEEAGTMRGYRDPGKRTQEQRRIAMEGQALASVLRPAIRALAWR